MRKLMTKEVVFTNIYSAEIIVNEDGTPGVKQHAPMTVIGNLNQKQADKYIKDYYKNANVYKVSHETLVYEMEVEEFIKHAKVKEGDSNDDSSDTN